MTNGAAQTDTQWLDRPGGRIAFDSLGAGPLVVCVPGMGELRSTYRATAPALAAAGHRVVTMDLRGHGDSDATFDAYDDVATAGDLLALIEHLGEPALVIGNSLGAGSAAWAAAERPDLVRGLVLVGAYVRNPSVGRLATLGMRAMMAPAWAPRVWASYLPRLYPGDKPADFAEHRDAIVASMRRPGYAKAFSRTTRTSHAPIEARLGEVRAPVLVVMGDRDPDWKDAAAEARWITERLGGELLLVPGAGHYPQVQCPEPVNEAILDFAGRLTPRA